VAGGDHKIKMFAGGGRCGRVRGDEAGLASGESCLPSLGYMKREELNRERDRDIEKRTPVEHRRKKKGPQSGKMELFCS